MDADLLTSDDLPVLTAANLGRPITLDNRARPAGGVHVVVRGTLIGVRHYLDDEGLDRTEVQVRAFGAQVVTLEFIKGNLRTPAEPTATSAGTH